MSARRAWNRCRPVLLAPVGEHAQVEGVGVAGQAAVAGQEPDERGPLGLGEQRLDRHDEFGRRDGFGGHGDLQGLGRNPPLRARGSSSE